VIQVAMKDCDFPSGAVPVNVFSMVGSQRGLLGDKPLSSDRQDHSVGIGGFEGIGHERTG
jgi:hypothetical protein